MKQQITIIIAAYLIACPLMASAHQPRLVMDEVTGMETPIAIHNPEASQAFYGELKGRADYYEVRLSKRTDLYLSILSPRKGGRSDFNIFLSSGDYGRIIAGGDIKWTEYFEQYAGDWYLKGPEKTFNLPPGTYSIMVSSADNRGKYSLVVGTQESFPFGEALNALWLLPELKVRFFSEPAWMVFNGMIYQYLGTALVFILALIGFYISVWKYKRAGRTDRNLAKRMSRLNLKKLPGIASWDLPKLKIRKRKR